MKTSLIVGSRPECDVVVSVPSVSGRHCQASREGDLVHLQDLGSSNGTYVNGKRLTGADRAAITPLDVVHLASHQLDLAPIFAGLSVAVPTEGTLCFKGESAVVGRGGDNDIVVGLPMVSTRHARFTRVGVDVLVEDLGSANGTFIDDVRVVKPTILPRQGVLGLGSSRFRLSPDSWPEVAPPPPDATTDQGKTVGIAAGLAAGAVAAALAARTMGNTGGAGPLILSLAAPALGAVDVLALSLAGVRGSRALSWIVGAVAVQGAALGIIGAPSAIPSAMVVLALAGFVGASAAALLMALTPDGTGPRIAATLGLIAVMGLLGGLTPTLSDLPGMLRSASALSPTRWAFEGIVLADSAAKPIADRVFPAAVQMGTAADCAALALMAAGMAGVLAALRSPTRSAGDH